MVYAVAKGAIVTHLPLVTVTAKITKFAIHQQEVNVVMVELWVKLKSSVVSIPRYLLFPDAVDFGGLTAGIAWPSATEPGWGDATNRINYVSGNGEEVKLKHELCVSS
ncbi:hypothetical protein CHU98_g5399 [Xylaria longipes]|nr:hypothetical protein CHU98_g5399 [Xylaria longipes]